MGDDAFVVRCNGCPSFLVLSLFSVQIVTGVSIAYFLRRATAPPALDRNSELLAQLGPVAWEG